MALELIRNFDQLKREITQLEIEAAALKKEKDKEARKKLGKVKKEIARKQEKAKGLEAAWKRQKIKFWMNWP